ncbi:MAG: zf-HC2 domain-containing protein [Thermoleophilia bacterium]|jgi:anti-sigma factor RsiW|nr:zf-HC2 domain-containing protein [Thermoleophilia bacterium]
MSPPADDLPCIELVEMVTDYLEGALTPEARGRLEAHLEICGGCEAYVEQIRATIAAAGRTGEGSPPPEVRAWLLERFREGRD